MTPREQVKRVQRAVLDRGGSVGKSGADGIWGDDTFQGIMDMLAKIPETEPKETKFDIVSANRLKLAHPKIQEVMNAARAEIEFKVLDSQRGKAAQEKAFLTGHSKAHFGQSAHNWEPAIAVDLFPAPYDWNNRKSFVALFDVIMRIAKEKNIPLRSGLDWDMDGTNKGHDDWDGGHYELHPWREWAKSATPYAG